MCTLVNIYIYKHTFHLNIIFRYRIWAYLNKYVHTSVETQSFCCVIHHRQNSFDSKSEICLVVSVCVCAHNSQSSSRYRQLILISVNLLQCRCLSHTALYCISTTQLNELIGHTHLDVILLTPMNVSYTSRISLLWTDVGWLYNFGPSR
jgi:hypothetical protein